MYHKKSMNTLLFIMMLVFAMLAIDTLVRLPSVKVNVQKIQENK